VVDNPLSRRPALRYPKLRTRAISQFIPSGSRLPMIMRRLRNILIIPSGLRPRGLSEILWLALSSIISPPRGLTSTYLSSFPTQMPNELLYISIFWSGYKFVSLFDLGRDSGTSITSKLGHLPRVYTSDFYHYLCVIRQHWNYRQKYHSLQNSL
jgi:hypothetical protein